MTSQTQAELRRNYKLLKKAFKEEREFRANLETELMNKVQQYNQMAIEVEELKDRNLELYESNMNLQEQSAGLRHANRLQETSGDTKLTKDDAHMKEMLDT